MEHAPCIPEQTQKRPNLNPSPSRAQKRHFCALLPFGTPIFGLFEHKIEVFVLFWGPEPPFSGFSSTKSRFLCFFGLRNPHFRAFRAQNRHFCALLPARFFPMLPHCLPCRVSSGAATLPHRLPLRSIPPQRFACGSSHSRGHGRPRSVRKSSRLRWKGLSARLYLSTGLLLLRQTQICRPICTDCLRHLRISAR